MNRKTVNGVKMARVRIYRICSCQHYRSDHLREVKKAAGTRTTIERQTFTLGRPLRSKRGCSYCECDMYVAKGS